MIVVRQNPRALFSLIAFIILCLLCSYFFYIPNLGIQSWPIANLLGYMIPLAIGLGLIIRIVCNWRTIYVGKDKFRIEYLLKWRSISFKVQEITKWKVENIKTFGNSYEQLNITPESCKELGISKAENTSYDELKRYLEKKAAKKRIY